MKKIIALILVVFSVVAVFAACGGNNDTSTPDESGRTVDTDKYPSGYPFPIDAYKGETLTSCIQMKAETSEGNAIYKEFEEATGATIVDPGQYPDLAGLVSAITSGTGPDIAACDQRLFLSAAIKGLMIPLTDVLDLTEDIYTENGVLNQSMVDFFSLNGVPYMFNTLGAGSSCAYIIYRKSFFEEAGLEDPYEIYLRGEWDFEHFNEAAAALTYDSDDDGLIDKYAITGYMDGFWPGCAGGDANVVRWKEGKPVFALTDPDLIECYDEYFYLMKNQYYFAIGDPGADFVSGKHAMMGAIGGWYTKYVTYYVDPDDLGYVPMPYAPSNTSKVVNNMGYASGIFFTNNIRNKELAEDWVKYYYFWRRADHDYEKDAQEIIDTNYAGNADWYNFEQELCKNMFFNNAETFGNLPNITTGVIYNPSDSFSNMIQEIAPAAQAEINSVYDDAYASAE